MVRARQRFTFAFGTGAPNFSSAWTEYTSRIFGNVPLSRSYIPEYSRFAVSFSARIIFLHEYRIQSHSIRMCLDKRNSARFTSRRQYNAHSGRVNPPELRPPASSRKKRCAGRTQSPTVRASQRDNYLSPLWHYSRSCLQLRGRAYLRPLSSLDPRSAGPSVEGPLH